VPPAAADSRLIFTGALFRGEPDEPAAVSEPNGGHHRAPRKHPAHPREDRRLHLQEPPGHSAWKLVDEAGWRGRLHGGAKFSELHSNFLINTGEATAADLEGLGETVRSEVLARTGVQLDWEIKRIGPAA
jgi:UDP-N-acetylmuramate dehydrogenase